MTDLSVASSHRALLTVAGSIPDSVDADIAARRRPRADYRVLAERLGADIVDHQSARDQLGWVGRVIERLAGPNGALAVACWRRRGDVDLIFTDSERVGFPLAALMRWSSKRPRHVMIAHRLSPPKKRRLHQLLGLRRAIDHVIVYASEQRRVARSMGYRPEQVTLTTFMVDTQFWRAEHVTCVARHRPMICAAGQELRDYPTLVAAVRDLDVDLVIAAASPWSRRSDSSSAIDLPPGVTVVALSLFDLRQLYADADAVVVPLVETDFQAGITTILEAMAMGRAVICTRTTGQTDTVVDGATGRYVPASDVEALRATIEAVLATPDETERLAAAGQRWVRNTADIDVYADRLAAAAALTR